MGTLYGYQDTGADWLTSPDRTRYTRSSQRAAYLADEMGLGKSVQAAVAADRAGVGSALVVAPASTLDQWRQLWREWGPDIPRAFLSYASPDLDRLEPGDFGMVVLDEAHYVKSPTALRSRRALRLAIGAELVLPLSGTPMPNHPGELWPVVRTLWPGIPHELGIKDYRGWFDRFCVWVRTRYGPRVVGVREGETLRRYLGEIMLRRELSEVSLELPPLRLDVQLLPQDEELEEALEGLGLDPEGLEEQMRALSADREQSSTLRRLLGTYKAPLVGDILARELDDRAYPKLVVMAHHMDTMDILADKLQPFGLVRVQGSTPKGQRAHAVERFTEDAGVRVFLGQQTSTGVGLNLQVASEIVLVEPDWTDNSQAIKRVHRIGSEHPVRARIFAVAGTLDVPIMRVAAGKAANREELGL